MHRDCEKSYIYMKCNRMSEIWWKNWDYVRDSIPWLGKYMEKIECKISNKLLNSSKNQIGCFHKYPVATVFNNPKANYIYKESEEMCAYKVVSKPRSAPDFEEEKAVVDYFPEYIAVLNNAEVIPCTDVVIKDGVMLCDRFEFDKKFLSTLLMNRVVYDKEHIILRINRTEFLKGEYINMCYAGGGNIWHMTHCMLSKMQLVNSCEELNHIPLLMDEHIKTNKFARQYISCFNQNKHKIIYLRKDRLYRIEKLYMVSASGVVKRMEPMDKSIVIFSKGFTSYVRNVMLDKMHAAHQKKKFFIKRRDKRLVNEGAVISYLQSKGFEVIRPEKYSFIEELSLFYNAECIVGASGAGLTNILYVPKECNVICIVSKERIFDAKNNATVIQDIGAKVYYCPAKAISKDGVINPMSFRVNIAELERIYNHIYPDSI